MTRPQRERERGREERRDDRAGDGGGDRRDTDLAVFSVEQIVIFGIGGRHEEWIDRDDLVFDPHLSATDGDLADDAEFRVSLQPAS